MLSIGSIVLTVEDIRRADGASDPDGADWIVLEDTEGDRLCVVDTGPYPLG
ncbi:hypothetical protein [Microbacterium sp. LWH3-1.2]|uniref:hypothetical protein n=1 Tax=Microbacterium sp. LWH3-1.2 TaxID=3135256 RepID=UPI0034390E98